MSANDVAIRQPFVSELGRVDSDRFDEDDASLRRCDPWLGLVRRLADNAVELGIGIGRFL